jgi:hypothetical protein
MAPEPTIYKNYKIFHFGDGFTAAFLFGEGSNSTLYTLTHFVATKDDTLAYEFSFGINTMGWSLQGNGMSKDDLVEAALATVKARLDVGDLEDRKHYAYGYNFDEMKFESRESPIWRVLPAR